MSIRGDILDNMESALQTLTTSNAYPIQISTVLRFNENWSEIAAHDSPLLAIEDTGIDILDVWDDAAYRFRWTVTLVGVVNSQTSDDVQAEMNSVIADVKQLIDSSPDLGDNVLRWRFVQGTQIGYDEQNSLGIALMETELIYYVEETF